MAGLFYLSAGNFENILFIFKQLIRGYFNNKILGALLRKFWRMNKKPPDVGRGE
jgi:hypothetical protein